VENVTYPHPPSHTLSHLPGGGNLQFSAASCLGVISNGDPATLDASYPIGPALTLSA
jgi:hypothetical protein